MIKNNHIKRLFILALLIILCLSIVVCVSVGAIDFTFSETLKGLFVADDSVERLIIFKSRLPRIIIGGLVGIALATSGCILQGLMRNKLASPSTIGVTSGASFVGYVLLVAAPVYSYLLPVGTILGAFITTMLIYILSYQKGVSTGKMILAGLAVSAVFSAFNDIIKTVYSDRLSDIAGFLVGSLNGVAWSKLYLILPYVIIGVPFCLLFSKKMNILLLGDDQAKTLGLNTNLFRFLLICVSSLLAGASIAVAGMISFVGLIVPHIARIFVGSDYKYLFPTSMLLGAILVIVCDTIGRTCLSTGEISVSIILSLIGAPFFLILLRNKKVKE